MEKDPSLALPKRELEKIITAHDGDMALLYLYWRLHGTGGEEAARDLCMTSAAVDAAEEKLLRLGISSRRGRPASADHTEPAPEKKLSPAEEMPSYTGEDIANRGESDPAFASVIHEAQNLMGRQLATNDLKILMGIYDYLGLPAEVIMVLMTYCVQRYEEKRGAGRRPTFRHIEKEAYSWANNGILSLDEADRYLVQKKERDTLMNEAADAVEIHGRELTASEIRYLGEWLDLGITPGLMGLAYDRTVTNTGKRTWKYMDTMLRSWHDKGFQSPADVEAKERPVSRTRTSKPAGSRDTAKDRNDNLDRLFRKLKREGDDSE